MKRILLCLTVVFCYGEHVLAVDFSRSIRPILSDYCFQCHGPDAKERAADLHLDTEEGIQYAFAGGDFASSEAWRRIQSDDPDEHMPPPEFPKKLSPQQKALLEQWMNAETPWSQHWAFAKPVRVEPTDVSDADHPIDRFVIDRLRQEGLRPSPPASRETLIRRLKFDLLGLPPTLHETAAFVADASPDAYEQLVDRLLESPHYGEHMAVEWLDGARYADTNGYQNDFKRSMWPWRDWVIKAFNDNLPFDQFVVEQLAGDLLADPSLDQRIATGFNRNHRTVTEAGSIQQEWLVENVIDRVETTATVFLGLTMGCARCHDHKYDPISQREFYQFFSFFHNVKEQGVYQEQRGNVAPLQPVLPDQDLQRLSDLRERRTELEANNKALKSELPKRAAEWSTADLAATPNDKAVISQFRLGLAGNVFATLGDNSAVEPTNKTGDIGWVDTVFGKAAKLSGLHELSYGQAIAPDTDQPFTFAFWVKPEKMGSIIDKVDLELDSRGLGISWQRGGRIEVQVAHSWPADALKFATERVNSVPRGQWSHVAIGYDGSKKAAGCTILINGKSVPVKAEADQLNGSIVVNTPLRIGAKKKNSMYFGELSDLRYFDQALPEKVVAAIANEGLTKVLSREPGKQSELLNADRNSLYANFAQSEFAQQLRKSREALRNLRVELSELEAAQTVMVMDELPEPRQTYVLKRGEYDKPDKTQPVSAEVPSFLGSLPTDVKKDRLALANWLIADDHPLTARVRVNRIWQMLFGVGLVKTAENFGVQAEAPSHPELLDWLATEFVRLNWDTKALLKLIVTSETYRQSSVVTAEHLAKDSGNRLLARGPRFRLSAESIRDNALAVSGLLTKKVGGPSIKPYQPAKLWDELAGGAGEGPYVQSQGDDLYRRSLYIYRKRTVPHPSTSTFDAPSFEICQVARARTNTPLQALALMNDVTYVESARKLAERMLSEGGDTDEARLQYGFQLATGRKPTAAELATLQSSRDRKQQLFANDPAAAKQFLGHGESKAANDRPPEQLAAYSAVASVLLNLDETITKE